MQAKALTRRLTDAGFSVKVVPMDVGDTRAWIAYPALSAEVLGE